ncbi:hypothetical protein ACP275_02G137900 [Erythranthe tilingii]
MEFRHFSHNHGLVYHQVVQGSEIHCSGCKSAGSGNVYVCWQCSYFLHEHCFRSERSLKHPSHPLHPLTLVPSPTYPSGSFFCNSCNLGGDGFSYTCSECEFDIHVHCALNVQIPNPNLNPHLFPSPVPNPNHNLNPNPAQNYNPVYPPPIQSNAYPTYPPQNTVYPPNPNNPYPNFTPPNPITPPIPQNPAYPPNQNNNPIPAYQQPNIAPPYNYVPPANPAANPPPPPQPTVPIYSTVVNATPATNPPPPQPTKPEPKPAPNMIKHFSHPHVLKGMEIEQKNAKVCSACECELTGAAYCCTESQCNFNLHKTCFDSVREIRHKSHLEHPLTLLAEPPYSEGFTCNACLKEGRAFTYTCAACSYDLHIDCVQWPEKVTRSDHKHTLTLYYSSPAAAAATADQEVTFMCDVCMNPVHEMAWVYQCRECNFGTHLECVTSAVKQQSTAGSSGGGEAKTEEVTITEAELKFAVLQFLLEAQGRKAALDSI